MSGKARGKLTLERVLGLTTCSNTGLRVNNITGDIAYPAGCVVVMYNFQKDRQTRYYRVEKPVAAIAFSADGKLLAIAERGHAPSITVWDVESGQLNAEFKKHKYGIATLAFSGDSRYLVSIGLVHDKLLCAWDLVAKKLIGGSIVEEKVYAIEFSVESRAFVSVGQRHVQFWPLDTSFKFTGRILPDQIMEIQSIPATMSRLTDATFVDVGCGAKTIAITSDGYLCCFGGTTMERLVSLEASGGFALSVSAEVVAVGGASATIRLFDPISLEYKQTLPFPPKYGAVNEPDQFDHSRITPEPPEVYPAAIAVRLVGGCLVAIYSDHTLVVFDVPSIRPLRSFFFHHGPIRDLQLVGKVIGLDTRQRIQVTKTRHGPPEGTFVTCGDDRTIRFWNLDRHKKHPPVDDTVWKNPYCVETLRVYYGDEIHPKPLPGYHDSIDDIHVPKETQEIADGFKCIALSESALSAGSNDGNITIFSLEPQRQLRFKLPKAHTNGVLSLSYSQTAGLLASGGRDRMIHVHGKLEDGAPCLKSLENHSGAVFAVQFTADGKRLISAGADHNLVFTQVSDQRIFRYNSFPVKGGKIHSMAVIDNDYIVSCVNASVDVHTLISNKHVQTHALGEHHYIELSPGAALMALGGSTHDKCIYVVDFHSGEILAKAAGHGDVITGLKFTLDGRRIISTSSDGCVFVWRLSDDLQSTLRSKIHPIPSTTVMEMPSPPMPPSSEPAKDNSTTPSAPIMPPPAPPAPEKKVVLPEKPTAWQDNKAVTPGPLAQVELDEWMKTRNVPRFEAVSIPLPQADPPVQALGSDVSTGRIDETSQQEAAGDLLLNKDLVPTWARTARYPTSSDQNAPEVTDLHHLKGKWAVNAVPDPIKSNEESTKLDLTKNNESNPSQQGSADTSTMSSAAKYLAKSDKISKLKPPSTLVKIPSPAKVRKWAARSSPDLKDSIALCNESDDENDQDSDELELSETLYIKQSNGDLHPLEVPVSDSKSLVTSTSWSLAHERDVLNKKKKQQETANAVAEMQAKLGELGILKPKLSGMNIVTRDTSPLDQPQGDGYKKELSSSLEINQQYEQSMAEMTIESRIENVTKTVDVPQQSNPALVKIDHPRGMKHVSAYENINTVSQSIDNTPVDKSLSHFVSGFTKISAKSPPKHRISASLDMTPVDISLSHFVSGYNEPHKRKELTMPSPMTSIDTTPVDVSLSHFVAGYNEIEKQSGLKGSEQLASIDVTPVDISLSHFVAGYNDSTPKNRRPPKQVNASSSVEAIPINTPTRTPVSSDNNMGSNLNAPVEASVDFTPVDVSLSNFVSGHSDASRPTNNPMRAASIAESIDFTPVDKSLSHFVSGFNESRSLQAANVMESIDTTPVDQSLGQFVSGYSGVAESADLTPINVSLGQFVSGYNENDDDIKMKRKSSSIELDSNLLTAADIMLSEAKSHSTLHSSSTSSEEEKDSCNSSRSSSMSSDGEVNGDLWLSQYVSGFRASIDLTPVDHPQDASADLNTSKSGGDVASKSSSTIPSTPSIEKENSMGDSVKLSSSGESNHTSNPEPVKQMVRSLRHLEVSIETTVRQLEDVRPGGDPEVDEILTLAATLQSKIAKYADRTHE